ncbi:unnamed protein product, partial [Ixodes persulcatus]
CRRIAVFRFVISEEASILAVIRFRTMAFQRDAAMHKKWIVVIRRDEGAYFKVTKSTKVCSKHFRPCDFIPGVASGNSLLRDTAFPTVFNFGNQLKCRKAPRQRTAQRCTPMDQSQACATASVTAPESSAENNSEEPPPPQADAEMACLGEDGQIEEDLSLEDLESLKRVVAEQAIQILRLTNQCDFLKEELSATKTKVHQLQRKNNRITELLEQEQAKTASFCIERFKDCDEDFAAYCLPSYQHFAALTDFLDPGDGGCNVLRTECVGGAGASSGRKRKLTMENELFLVLVRLRLGLFEHDLAHRFCIAQSTVSRICSSWINFMYLKLSTLPLWAPRKAIDATMPGVFIEKYPTTRVILDATEVKYEVPSSLSLQSSSYSAYKSANTFKGLIGIAPNGLVTFVSELFTGSISDRQCVIRSGFLGLSFDQDDAVMAEKGFVVGDLLEKKGVKLNIPPFLHRREFSEEDVKETKEIASLRIHVEQRIRRIKSFHIFDRIIPLKLAPVINQMWTVAAILTNF